MFYREAGDFKTSYTEDNQTFPIAFDRYRYYIRAAGGPMGLSLHSRLLGQRDPVSPS